MWIRELSVKNKRTNFFFGRGGRVGLRLSEGHTCQGLKRKNNYEITI